ncbi:MAG: class I SAM-dependent methyltransferase [Salinimicrobium sp.]
MNRALLNKEVQDYIDRHYKEEISKILFRGSPFQEVSVQELGAQLNGKKKAEKKLPEFFNKRGIIYPPLLNLEQTSSEVTAKYKTSLVEGKSLLDLTGGFGIDSFYFSKSLEEVSHCELNTELSELAKQNFKTLNAGNINTIPGDGISFLKSSSERFDWVYVDPSRRDYAGGRVFFLSDCLPNVPENLDLIFSHTENILIKTSPLLDLQAGLNELHSVKEIHIVAVDNEVKELLWVLKKGFLGNVRVHTVNFQKKKLQVFDDFFGRDYPAKYSLPLKWLYEPNAAIMKSRLFSAVGERFGLKKLHPNTNLFTSEALVDFPGRKFEVLQVLPFKKKQLKARLNFSKAHISTRNFPLSVENLRKQLKLMDGGENYLFFITNIEEKKVVMVCKKVPANPTEN